MKRKSVRHHSHRRRRLHAKRKVRPSTLEDRTIGIFDSPERKLDVHRAKRVASRADRPEETVPPPSRDGARMNRLLHVRTPEMDAEEAAMTVTSDDPLSTFAIDVDNGSYTLARARLREQYPPKKEKVRLEEFVNYFHYDYPQPEDDLPFAVTIEGAPDPFATTPDRKLLRIGVQGKDVSDSARKPAHLTFLIDVSGSMFGPHQLGLVKEALTYLTGRLHSDDTVAIVTYARGAKVQLWPAGAKESDLINKAIGSLKAGGSTALDAGLDLAYRVAATHFVAGETNRVVLLSDGRANVGKRDPKQILRSVWLATGDGVQLSTIGFGAEEFDDEMMEQLADKGDGNYYFVDSFKEAQRIFGEALCGTLQVIAKDVKIQVEFDPKTVERYELLGYENRRIADRDFRNDAADAGEIGAGHAVTALYEIRLTDDAAKGRIGTVRVRFKPPDGSKASEVETDYDASELERSVSDTSSDFRFAAAVASFARLLTHDVEPTAAHLDQVLEIAGHATRGDPDREEFVKLAAGMRIYWD